MLQALISALIKHFLAFLRKVISFLLSFSYFHVYVCLGYAYVCAHSFRCVWRTVCVWMTTHTWMPACGGPMSRSSYITLTHYSWWIVPQSNPEPSHQVSHPALVIPSLSSAATTNHLSVLSIWTPTIPLPCEANTLTAELSALLSLLFLMYQFSENPPFYEANANSVVIFRPSLLLLDYYDTLWLALTISLIFSLVASPLLSL